VAAIRDADVNNATPAATVIPPSSHTIPACCPPSSSVTRVSTIPPPRAYTYQPVSIVKTGIENTSRATPPRVPVTNANTFRADVPKLGGPRPSGDPNGAPAPNRDTNNQVKPTNNTANTTDAAPTPSSS
jgi:hypothetical protein